MTDDPVDRYYPFALRMEQKRAIRDKFIRENVLGQASPAEIDGMFGLEAHLTDKSRAKAYSWKEVFGIVYARFYLSIIGCPPIPYEEKLRKHIERLDAEGYFFK